MLSTELIHGWLAIHEWTSVDLGWFGIVWDRLGIAVGSSWPRFDVVVGSLWVRRGAVGSGLKLFEILFGSI